MMGFKGLVDVMDHVHVGHVIKVGNFEEFFGLANAFFGQRRRSGLLIHLVVSLTEAADEIIHFIVE